MEPYPGVFVSSVRAEEWEPDPEVPGSDTHELVHADGVWAGLTRFTAVDGPVPWTPSQRETIHVLEGEVIRNAAVDPCHSTARRESAVTNAPSAPAAPTS
jgi:hypothetical protein